MPGSGPFEIEGVVCSHATEKALLVVLDDGEEEWVPRSVVHDDSEVYEKGHEGTLVVLEWWADKQGWL